MKRIKAFLIALLALFMIVLLLCAITGLINPANATIAATTGIFVTLVGPSVIMGQKKDNDCSFSSAIEATGTGPPFENGRLIAPMELQNAQTTGNGNINEDNLISSCHGSDKKGTNLSWFVSTRIITDRGPPVGAISL
ncbi:MAG: hypothetical protein WC470_01380 [Candidatus Paceibacterota bacterium]